MRPAKFSLFSVSFLFLRKKQVREKQEDIKEYFLFVWWIFFFFGRETPRGPPGIKTDSTTSTPSLSSLTLNSELRKITSCHLFSVLRLSDTWNLCDVDIITPISQVIKKGGSERLRSWVISLS